MINKIQQVKNDDPEKKTNNYISFLNEKINEQIKEKINDQNVIQLSQREN